MFYSITYGKWLRKVEDFMQKTHIAEIVQKELQISDKEYKEALEVMLEKIGAALINGEKVTLRNFGTFIVKCHEARKGVNPQTGNTMPIPKKWVVKFNSCKALKKAVDEGGRARSNKANRDKKNK